MKKSLLYLVAGSALFVSVACKKTNTSATSTPASETVTAVIDVNGSYRYALPADFDQSTYFENSGVASATVSVETDNGSSAFIYTPPQGYSGTDAVVISNVPVQSTPGSCQGGQGGCRKGGPKRQEGSGCSKSEAGRSITFNITVSPVKN